MPLILKAKPGVVWNVVPAIEDVQSVIKKCYKDRGSEATVTSAKDGKHSKLSAHHQEKGDPLPASGIDLRIWNLFRDVSIDQQKEWWLKVHSFSKTLAKELNANVKEGRFDVVVEVDHLHVEWSKDQPNIKGFKPGEYVYLKQEVKEAMA